MYLIFVYLLISEWFFFISLVFFTFTGDFESEMDHNFVVYYTLLLNTHQNEKNIYFIFLGDVSVMDVGLL